MKTEQMQKVADQAAAHYSGEKGFENKNRINLYRCRGGCATVTIDREPGVTPFTTECPVCKRMKRKIGTGFYETSEAVSHCYRVSQNHTPTHEWYRPDSIMGLSDWEKEHVLKGGLLLRPITMRPGGRYA